MNWTAKHSPKPYRVYDPLKTDEQCWAGAPESAISFTPYSAKTKTGLPMQDWRRQANGYHWVCSTFSPRHYHMLQEYSQNTPGYLLLCWPFDLCTQQLYTLVTWLSFRVFVNQQNQGGKKLLLRVVNLKFRNQHLIRAVSFQSASKHSSLSVWVTIS